MLVFLYIIIVVRPEKKLLTRLAPIKRDEVRAAADLAAQKGHVHGIHLVVPRGTIHIVQLKAPDEEPVRIVRRLTPRKGAIHRVQPPMMRILQGAIQLVQFVEKSVEIFLPPHLAMHGGVRIIIVSVMMMPIVVLQAVVLVVALSVRMDYIKIMCLLRMEIVQAALVKKKFMMGNLAS